MEMEDTRLIIMLEAVSLTAERAWNRLENRDRCKPAPEEDRVDISSREPTPATKPDMNVVRDGSEILLTFHNKPKNLEKGFVFGSDPRVCDIVLGGRGAGFSRQHFRITFNERGEVIFENTSQKKASVQYKGEPLSRRNHFTWILFQRYDPIKIQVDNLTFKVWQPDHRRGCLAEYEAHREAYLEERHNALPTLGQLDVESQQTTAPLTAVHSPRQQPIYLPEEELGRGGFGTVYKAVDVSTGNIYAAKVFLGGHWKKEVEILKRVSHEHIVQFVDFSDEHEPLLVMEYLPLGNLACQYSMSEEETLQILYQGLQALEYLHSQTPPVAHRDMKLENILVQSRTPFVIKLVDFGLAKNDASLKTFCGTNQYAAPEIWEHRRYTPLVDIWSLGVIVVHYGYGLPKPSHKRKGMPWCQDLSQFAEDREGEGDALMDLISTKMLRMRYEQRQSARHCLGEVRRLGFHVIQPFDEGRTTPPRKTSTQGRATMTKSILMQTRQTAPLDRNKYLGCYATSGASLRTEVATSKRELREGVHFSDLASPQSLNRNPQRPTQIGNPRSEDKGTLSKRRRPQTTQSPTADPVGEGQSKRARASVSCEASEQLSKASNPRPGPERSIDSDPGGPFTINVASFVQETASLPQVAPESARDRAISLLGRSSAQAATVNSIETEKPLLKRNVHNDVRAMLDENLDGKDEGTREVTDFDAGHIQMRIDNKTVLMRKEDCFLNATQILTLANKNASDRKYLISLVKEQTKIQVLPATAGVPHPCSWVNFQHGLILCKYLELEHQLQPLINYGLRAQRDGSKTPVPVYDYLTEKLSRFFVVHVLPQPVSVQRLDFRVNASHIFRLAGHSRTITANFRDTLRPEAYEILRGSKKHQGTYVDFDVAIELCRKLGLAELEGRLDSLKRTSEKPVLEAELSHVRPWRQHSRRVPESPGSDIVLTRNESTQPRGVWNRVQRPPSSAEPITDEPIQAEEARETDLDSDEAGSDEAGSDEADSDEAGPSGIVSTCEPRSIERDPQPVPSIRDSGDAAPSRQAGREIRHSFRELADSHSDSARSAQYEVWDSQSQVTVLTEVRPNLTPSTCNDIFSHYGSFGDLFAPI